SVANYSGSLHIHFLCTTRHPPTYPLFPYTTLFRSAHHAAGDPRVLQPRRDLGRQARADADRPSACGVARRFGDPRACRRTQDGHPEQAGRAGTRRRRYRRQEADRPQAQDLFRDALIMQVRIVAVGTRMPTWVGAAVDDYARRLPGDWRVEWREVRAEPRGASGHAGAWMQREAERIRGALPAGARL